MSYGDLDLYVSSLCAFRRLDRFLECSPGYRGEVPFVMQWSDAVVFPQTGGRRKLFMKFRWVILFRLNISVWHLEEGSVTVVHQEISAIPDADVRIIRWPIGFSEEDNRKISCSFADWLSSINSKRTLTRTLI
jgi:hypothetical protein